MNQILIIDASDSDRRLMSGLLTRAGYEPIVVDSIEAAKEKVVKLPPGAVIVSALSFRDGTAKELINWLKAERLKTPVIAIVNNINTTDTYDIMRGCGAIDVVQRPAINKQLVEIISQYARPENLNLEFDDEIIPRKSEAYRFIANEVDTIAATNVNCIVFGESGTGEEQIAKQIYQKSSRIDKPLTIVEAGGAAIVGEHDPTILRSETYNRIAGYFKNTDGGTIIVKNVHLLNFGLCPK